MSTKITKTVKNFEIECTGLKPKTIHKFFYEGVDNTSLCKSDMPGEKNTTTLKTDSNGKIRFRFALPVEMGEEFRDGPNLKYLIGIKGNKQFELKATDSSAKKTILFADL
jgi:hypothetical protein